MHSYSFCSDCYLQEDNLLTVDPRTITNSSNHGLNTPSLIDVSERQDARGEAAVEHHDDSPNLVYDCAMLVSEASQNVAEECEVRPLYESDNSSGSHFSSPLLDNESGNHTSVPPLSPWTATPEPIVNMDLTLSPTIQSPVPMRPAVPTPPARQLMCSKCPRTFSSQAKARYAPNFGRSHSVVR